MCGALLFKGASASIQTRRSLIFWAEHPSISLCRYRSASVCQAMHCFEKEYQAPWLSSPVRVYFCVFQIVISCGEKNGLLSQYVSDPSEEKNVSVLEPGAPPAQKAQARFSNMGIITLFVLIGLSLLLFSGQIILGLTQTSPASAAQQALPHPTRTTFQARRSASPTPAQGFVPTPTPTPVSPFFTPSNAVAPALQLPSGHYVLYQTTTHLYLVSTTDNTILPIYTPSYTYNQAVRPILTPDGRLIYSGDQGIWITDMFDAQPTQIAHLDPNMVIASLALSQDGKMIAWSTEPMNGIGQMSIYAGPLASPQLIRQSTLDCPCFRVFSFLNGTGTTADQTLLLTDDRGGSNEAVQYGLWSLDISTPSAEPQQIMDENTQQGPLAFIPYSNTLLYAPYEGAVPAPTDGSVPSDVAALSYADSLSLTTLSGSALMPGDSQVVLPRPKNAANSALDHWITTPTFSPDGHTLAYVEFSTDTQDPYDRHSALYTVQINGTGSHIQAGRPQLVATSTARLFELGSWLNSHVITMYGDGSLYVLDVQSGAMTMLVHPGGYVRILGIV
jgi:hypothetical protein